MSAFNTPLADYWSIIHNRATQETVRMKFGSEVEAQSGGSSATFRLSDSPEYVSKIFSDDPVSFANLYPDVLDEMREAVHLERISGTDDRKSDPEPAPEAERPLLKNEDDFSYNDNNPFTENKLFGNELFGTNWVNVGLFLFALVLVLGGLFIIANNTETGRNLIQTGSKAALPV
jgi:hypothetical protein